ncbi:S8 family serine peptidase [Streptomyces sp. NBS 14/10]|uniref:S8 family serine peptidase n=1 Tax=Streptomyces sp. NBS 14/10 TaxID=1945643 RepID=UPI000B9D2A7E|nr:S8 family serine peptidase [Streptomyces sp. NBS 14/10]KAK1183465.1 S8 family serine peptidase [Streptomyces sp. NBS 14/10]
MRRTPSSRPLVTRAVAAAALTAASLASVVPSAAADPGSGSVELPALISVLPSDDPCAKASKGKAEDATWSRSTLGLGRAWELSQGAGVTVAVVDSGVGTDIQALSGRVTAVGDAGQDCTGHGSFAAGLIAAAPGKGVGVAGVAPKARILAVRGARTRGETTVATLAAGIRTAVDKGADVIYVGWVLATGKAELTKAAAYAAEHDALVVAPVGPDFLPRDRNTGQPAEPAPWYWPASAPGVLSVIDYGPDGKRPDSAPALGNADLAAPGDAVVSVGPKGSGHYIGSGSSLAAAHVAGAAALVRARYPEMSAAEVARQLTVAAYPSDTPRVDPYAAVSSLLTDKQGATPKPAAVHVPPAAPPGPRHRALVIAGAGGGLLLLVAAGAVVIPRGRARGWRPAGAEDLETAEPPEPTESAEPAEPTAPAGAGIS